MFTTIKDDITSAPVLSILFVLLRTYSRTFRLSVENEKEWLDYLDNGGTVLLCTWHQQFFPIIRHFMKYRHYDPALMISQSRDGEIVAGIAERSGWYPVRGSSSKGGHEALKVMIEKLRQSRLAVHIVDGPRGPAGKVKPGVIRLAHATGAAIVPFYTSADRAWHFNSWDRFMLPKPFARVRLQFDKMLLPGRPESRDDLNEQRLRLETIMAEKLIKN